MQSTFYQQGEESKITIGVLQLVASVARLRSPIAGCVWFRRQTFQSLRRYLLEEVYEVLEPLASESPEKLKEELGDLLFQIIVLCQLASECGWFSLPDVFHHINEKIIHRNPHVFGELQADTMEAVQSIWMEQKALERIGNGNGTSWMGMFCLNMLTIALELATKNLTYEDIATKFFEHFLYIAEAMNNIAVTNGVSGQRSRLNSLLLFLVALYRAFAVETRWAAPPPRAALRRVIE